MLVLGWASYDGSKDLCIIKNGALTGGTYVNEIIHEFLRPYAGAIGPDYVLMGENVRSLQATEYLEREGIERIDWLLDPGTLIR